MGLIAAEMERRGIATVAIQLLLEVAKRVRPPRGLYVPFAHGYPLAVPGDAARQHEVIDAALRLLEDAVPPPPVLVVYGENAGSGGRASWCGVRRW